MELVREVCDGRFEATITAREKHVAQAPGEKKERGTNAIRA
jgi:hypothetical protein